MDIRELIEKTPSVWERLKTADKPVVLYGMGNGALKVIEACERYGVQIAQIFASDGFVRGHSFCGHKVLTLSEVEELYGDFIILLGFGSSLPEVTERFYSLSERYELYAPDVPLAFEQDEMPLFTKQHALSCADEMQEAYDLLADDISKRVFESVLRYKLSGKIEPLKECETPRAEMFELIRPGKNEVYLDLGAYDGDTAYEFAERAPGYERIIALEPDPKNYKKLCRNLAKNPIDRLEAVNAPVWDKPEEVAFAVTASRNSGISDKGKNRVAAVTIDSILDGGRVTYIKMDVEGAEVKALRGGESSIKKYLPRLAVSAYHRNDDMFSLPLLIHSIASEYKIYLRHHPYVPAWETNVYAVR